MKVGISVTTYNRPFVLDFSLQKIRENTPDAYIVVVDDHSDTHNLNRKICKNHGANYLFNTTRRGIPRSKERAFRRLLFCDCQFWFDDDCFPRRPEWSEMFIHALNDMPHLLYLKEWHHIHRIEENGIIDRYTGATACFMGFDKSLYNEMRGFSQGYGKYGHWHHELSLSLVGGYYTIIDAEDYLFSFDLDGIPKGFNRHFQSSMPVSERRGELKKFKHMDKSNQSTTP